MPHIASGAAVDAWLYLAGDSSLYYVGHLACICYIDNIYQVLRDSAIQHCMRGCKAFSACASCSCSGRNLACTCPCRHVQCRVLSCLCEQKLPLTYQQLWTRSCALQQVGMKFATALLLTLALAGSASAIAPLSDAAAGWRQGRATFYGGSQQYLSNFPDRYSQVMLPSSSSRPRTVHSCNVV